MFDKGQVPEASALPDKAAQVTKTNLLHEQVYCVVHRIQLEREYTIYEQIVMLKMSLE